MLIVPGLVETFWARALPWYPTEIGGWIDALGKAEPRNWITPVVYFVTIVVLLGVAQLRFRGDEL